MRSTQTSFASTAPNRRQCLAYLSHLGWASAGLSSMQALAQNSQHALHVLLIGNSRYQHNAALANPERDVKLLEQIFQSRGARTHILLNKTAGEMDTAIQAFLNGLPPNNAAIWIGYSGHAVQIEGRNYLQGIDSDFSTVQRVRSFGVNLDKVVGLIERARTQPQAAVVAIDACRNNPFEPERTRGVAHGLAPQEPKGICISFSTAPYTKALDGDEGKYSPYAQALAQALTGKKEKSLDHVLRETADAVFGNTKKKQTPEYRSALRAEWWFEHNAVGLRPHATKALGTTTLSATTREVAYRPDEPSPQSEYAHFTAADWAQMEVEMQRQMQLRCSNPAQVRKLLPALENGKLKPLEQLVMANCLQEGLPNMPANPKQARRFLQPLAQQSHAIAQNLLGESWFAEGAYDHAYKWLSLAARSGYGRARTNLGHMHMLGHNSADPTAGALQMLQGMLQQSKEQLGSTPKITPEVLKEAEFFQNLIRGTNR